MMNDAGAVKRHLDDILASPGFARSKRLGAFLSFVVTRAVEGDAGAISERNIAIQVYGRPADFDPKVDGIVRAEAIRLRHKLREFYEPAPEGGPRIEIPKGGYVPVFSGFESPVEEARVAVAGTVERPFRVRPVVPFLVLGSLAVLVAVAGWRYVAGSAGPGGAAGLMAEANERRLVGDMYGAEALLDRAVAIDPDRADVHLARAAVMQRLGRLKQAAQEIGLAQEIGAEGELGERIAVRSRWIHKDYPATVNRLREMLQREPDSLELNIDFAGVVPDVSVVLATARAARRLPGGAENPELDRLEAFALAMQGKNKDAIEVAMRGERKAAALKATYLLARLTVLEGGIRENDKEDEGLLTLARGTCAHL